MLIQRPDYLILLSAHPGSSLQTPTPLMHIDQLKPRFLSSELDFSLGEGASEAEIFESGKYLSVTFPDQIKEFYTTCNGVMVAEPSLNIYPLNELQINSGIIEFCSINRDHRIGFNTKSTNEAGQWDIINISTKYRITFTMASFWSNKIWAWLLSRREIWGEETHS